jgi:translation initiation factor 2 beta subunit (eIF-2beta)/eIF-5
MENIKSSKIKGGRHGKSARLALTEWLTDKKIQRTSRKYKNTYIVVETDRCESPEQQTLQLTGAASPPNYFAPIA